MERQIMEHLTERERLVLEFIPEGHENAIRRRDLAAITKMSERDVREIIYDMVVNRGIPIGSSTEPATGGYFLIRDGEDLEVATRHLKPRADAIFRRARVLEKIAREQFGRQLKLVVD